MSPSAVSAFSAHDLAARLAWSRLRDGWEVEPGSPSERALATAVLLDAPRHDAELRRAALAVLREPRPREGHGAASRRTHPSPTPEHAMQPITPYLIFDGDCRQAMTFYQRVLGGDLTLSTYGETGHSPTPETADWVIHARLANGARLLMASDRAPTIEFDSGSRMHLMLPCDDVASLERLYAELSDGGEATMPPHDAFWGGRFAMCVDRFGICWMLSHQDAAMPAPVGDAA